MSKTCLLYVAGDPKALCVFPSLVSVNRNMDIFTSDAQSKFAIQWLWKAFPEDFAKVDEEIRQHFWISPWNTRHAKSMQLEFQQFINPKSTRIVTQNDSYIAGGVKEASISLIESQELGKLVMKVKILIDQHEFISQ